MNEDPTSIRQGVPAFDFTLYPGEVRAVFADATGSQEIASEFALWEIWNLYRDRRPDSVCEVGHGIGTITYMLAQWRIGKGEYLAVEDNDWCIEEAKKNLGRWAGSVIWYYTMPVYMSFDLVIVDGPQVVAQNWRSCLNDRATVIFEGNRREQRALFERIMREQGRPFCRVHLKPPDRTKGIWVYTLEPSAEERWRMYGLAVKEFLKDLRARLAGRPVGKRRRA